MKVKSLCSLLIAVSAILIATEAVTVKLCYAEGWNYLPLMMCRFGLGLIILAVIALIIKKPLFLAKKDLLFGMGVAFLQILASSLLYIAFGLLPAATAILLFYCYPVLTAIASYFFDKENLTVITVVSLFCVVGGVAVFSGSVWDSINVFGLIVALACACVNSIYLVMIARLMRKGLEPLTFTIYIFFIGFLLFLIITLISGQMVLPNTSISWFYVVFLALVPTSMAMLLFNFGVDKTGATLAAIIYGLEVPATAFFAFLVFGDTWNIWQFLGAALIIFAVMLPNIIKNKQVMLEQPLKIAENIDKK